MSRTTYCPRCLEPSDGVLIYCDRHLPEVEAEVRALYPAKRRYEGERHDLLA